MASARSFKPVVLPASCSFCFLLCLLSDDLDKEPLVGSRLSNEVRPAGLTLDMSSARFMARFAALVIWVGGAAATLGAEVAERERIEAVTEDRDLERGAERPWMP